jgi:two-component sensor histidine kinase
MVFDENPIRIFFVPLLSLLLQYTPVAAQTDKAFAFNSLTINNGLSQGMVTRILQDHYGFMWFATLDGLNRYDGYRFIVYHHDAENGASITESFAQSLFEDSKGRLWIGTVSGGLDLFERETGTFIHVKGQESSSNSLFQGPINSISEDKHGNIWVQVYDKLYKIFVFKNGKTFNEQFLIHPVKTPFSSSFSFLSITKSGTIYYVNAKEGIMYKLDDESTEKWSVVLNVDHYQQQQNKTIEPTYRIVQLLEDKEHGTFYVFHKGGVTRFDEKTGAPEKIYRNAFFNNCAALLHASLDKNGIAWFSGVNNLSLFNTRAGHLNYATNGDPDLSRILMHTYSTYIDRSGLLWIGTSGYGILKCNASAEAFRHTRTSSDYSNMTVPEVLITGLKIHNEFVTIQTKGSPLTKPIYLTKKLILPYDKNFIAFEFASMDFTDPEKNLFKYKLEGLDKDWINSDYTRSATYANLNPGTYTFSVRGSNNDGHWNEKGASIQLIILPPWYLTWWFRVGLALSILFAAYTFYRFRLAQPLKLQNMRDRIAGDLHDEVGSNLSNIFIFSNIAQQKAEHGHETAQLLQKISDYTKQSMDAMDDIVWMINPRNDRFENIMTRMCTLAAEFAETSDCALHLDFDEKLKDVDLNMESRKNFYLIYKEALNNTAKYAECKMVWIEMKLDHSKIILKIKDDGKGFNMAIANKGNGMMNMKRRAEMLKGALTVTSSDGEGTTLQLSFKV